MTSPHRAAVRIVDLNGESCMDDANNSLNVSVVSGSGPGGGGDGAINDGVSSSIKASVLDYTSSNPLAVRLTDTAGDYVTAGGGTQYTEGDTDATITGTALMWESVGNALVPVSAATPLPVNIVSGSSSGTEFDEDTPHTTGDAGVMALAVFNDEAGTTLVDTDGDYAPIAVDNKGKVFVTGQVNTNIVGSTGAIEVFNDTEQQEDEPHASGDLGVMALAVRNDDTDTTFADTDGDYSAIAVDSSGVQYIRPKPGTTFTVGGSALEDLQAAIFSEDEPHSDGAPGQMALAVRNDAAATTLTDTDGDYSAIAVDEKGRVIVSDGGGSITVDVPTTVEVDVLTMPTTTVTGTVTIGSITAGDNNIGNVDVVTLPALPAGSNNIGDVDVLTMPTVTVQATDLDIRNLTTTDEVKVSGGAAHASPASGNPVYVAGRASAAIPTDVGADGDAAGMWTNRNGATVVLQAPHVGLNGDPWSLVHEAAQYTTTQTSTVLVAGGASEKIVVTKVQIQVGGITAGTLQLYFGTGAFSRGTSRAIFDGEFAPSATLKPGVIMDGPFIAGTNGDDLMVTDSAAINPLTINVWYYVVV